MTYEFAPQTQTIVVSNRRPTTSPEVALQRGKFLAMLIVLGCNAGIVFPGVNTHLQNSVGFLVRGGTPAKASATQLVSNTEKKESGKAIASPSNIPSSELGKKIIATMQVKGYSVRPQGNIVFVKGWYCKDVPDQWCDLQIVVKADGTILYNGRSTTRPGNAWYPSKSNPGGVFQINEGQFAAWKFGEHCGASGNCHPALVQEGTIKGTRSTDTGRQGESPISGIFGVNIHSGPKTYSDSVGLWSAGCLVASTRKEHEKFMEVVRGIYSDNDTITATVLKLSK